MSGSEVEATAAPSRISVSGDRAGAEGARRRRRWLFALLLIFVTGATLRVWGCFGQGYPYSFYPDEEGNVKRALRFGSEKTLDPKWFNKPAFGYYVIFAEYGAWYAGGRMVGQFEDADDFAIAYLNDQGPFYLIGRISTALFGALTLLLTYRLGRSLGGRTVGLLSALGLCVTVGHVASGQQVKMDVPAALFSTWCAAALVTVMRRGRMRDYVGMGLVGGLGMATKYYSAGLLVPFIYAHLFRAPRAFAASPPMLRSKRLFAGMASFVLGFFIGSPYNFLSSQWFDERVMPLFRFLGQRLFGYAPLGQGVDVPKEGGAFADPSADSVWDSLGHQASVLASQEGMGWFLTALAVVGLIGAVVRRRRRDGFLVVTIVFFFALLAIANQQFAQPRHLSSLYPLFAVAAAQGMMVLWGPLARRFRALAPAHAPVLALAVVACLPIPTMPVWEVVANNRRNTGEHPRLRAMEWIYDNVEAGSVILNDNAVLPLKHDQGRCQWVLGRLERLESKGRLRAVDLFRSLGPKWRAQLRSVRHFEKPVYDIIELVHTWQTSDLFERRSAPYFYNPLWLTSPMGSRFYGVLEDFEKSYRETGVRPADAETELWFALWDSIRTKAKDENQPPLNAVEYWSQATPISRPWLTSHEEPRPEGRPNRVHHPVAWFVTTEELLADYIKPKIKKWRPANFPDFTVFYRDLMEHYERWELDAVGGSPAACVRIFSLKHRFEKDPPVHVVPPEGGREGQ